MYLLIQPNGDNDKGEMSGRCELLMRNNDASKPKGTMGGNLKRELLGKKPPREKNHAVAIEPPVTPTTTLQLSFARSVNRGPHNDGGSGRVLGY